MDPSNSVDSKTESPIYRIESPVHRIDPERGTKLYGCVLWIIGATTVLFVVALFLLPTFNDIETVSRQTLSMNNLRQLAIAAQNHELSFKRLPPLFSRDKNGKPMHSWRVLILPWLEEDNLFNQIDLTKPWDHPDNIKFHQMMPEIFRDPFDRESLGLTPYIAISGNETAWDPTGIPRTDDDFLDGRSNTILFVEAPQHKVNWMQPIDMTIEQAIGAHLSGLLNANRSSGRAATKKLDGLHVAFADGSVRTVNYEDDLRTLLTIAGSKHVPESP